MNFEKEFSNRVKKLPKSGQLRPSIQWKPGKLMETLVTIQMNSGSRRTRAAFVSNHAEERSVVRSIDLSTAIANRFVLDAMRESRERKPPAKVRVEGVCCMCGAVGAVVGAGGWWCANACDAMVIRIDVD